MKSEVHRELGRWRILSYKPEGRAAEVPAVTRGWMRQERSYLSEAGHMLLVLSVSRQ